MTFEKVRETMVDTLNLELEDIKLESNLADDLEMDSLDAVELNIALEEAYGISIPDEQLAEFKTVKDIVDYIDANKAA
ncbi:MAG: acyl carrier protein [Eubacterium sp.]|nr:acyl carrier protein [Eubacterium sp.]